MVDPFHVVQLANKMLSTLRRRTTAELRGRRGRASDPEWKARRRLLRNREDLTDEQFARMWNPLLDKGQIGQTLLTAWIAKESLPNLLALAGTRAERHHIGHARWKFLTWCADSDIPEVVRLAVTVDRWWAQIAAFLDTGHSNAKSEGINRDQARRPQRLRLPQRRGPTPTHTLRHHPPSPRTPPHRSTLKTPHVPRPVGAGTVSLCICPCWQGSCGPVSRKRSGGAGHNSPGTGPHLPSLASSAAPPHRTAEGRARAAVHAPVVGVSGFSGQCRTCSHAVSHTLEGS
ncbi:transposase [Streptomyces sp. 8L]|uniref:transposase n=1 Tax=Streptomyces sp. 8L TaxID=2877242 RepID=UPI0035A903D8